MCLSPEAVCDITCQPLKRFDLDAAIIFSDILTIPYALGQKVTFLEGRGPILEEVSLKSLHLGQFSEKIIPILEGIKLTKKNLPPEKALIGFVGAPWTLATYMIGQSTGKNFNETIQFSLKNPREFESLINLLTQACLHLLVGQIEAGVDAVQIFDSWASSVPDFMVKSCVMDPLLTITKTLKKNYPHIPLLSFPKGAAYALERISQMEEVDCISFDSSTPFSVIKNIQKRKITQGNLDPNILWAGGPLLQKHVKLILENLCQDSKHIFNLGHGVLPTTPLEHIEKTIQLIRS